MTEARASAAAQRMRLSRERRRDGFRCIRLDIHDDEIDELVRRGLIRADERTEHDAVAIALGDLLGKVLAGASQ